MGKIIGQFITVEGPEGAGKTTNINFIKEFLENRGIELVITREPGGTQLGEQLRAIVLSHGDEPIVNEAELLLMFASRLQHVTQVIKPAIRKGSWVLCDRFTDASYAYQGGGREIALARISELAAWTLNDFQPDLTVLLDISVEAGMERVKKRGALDRFESQELDFFERVRKTYINLANENPQRIKCVDAAQNLDLVQKGIQSVLESFLSKTELM